MNHWSFPALLTLAAVGAGLRGGPVERRGVALFAVAGLVWLVAHLVWGGVAAGLWMFAIDAAVLLTLIKLVWRSPRPWPVYASGVQLLVVAGDIAFWVRHDLNLDLHLPLLAALRFGAISILATGTWFPPKWHQK
jgi:hypothetical protein